jgi:BASS family bile acid:Na+ symporter
MGLMLGIGSALLLTWREVVGAIGTMVFVGLAVVLVVGLIAGWLAGIGCPSSERALLGLATANRNIAAALVVAASIGGDALVYTLVGALTIPVVLIGLAGRIGRRSVDGRFRACSRCLVCECCGRTTVAGCRRMR